MYIVIIQYVIEDLLLSCLGLPPHGLQQDPAWQQLPLSLLPGPGNLSHSGGGLGLNTVRVGWLGQGGNPKGGRKGTPLGK